MSSLNYRDVNLLSYLPTYLKSYKEFKVLAEAEGPEIETVFNELNIIRSNQFINSCDEEGIEKFEDLIGISVNKNDNLETRKARVLIRWVQDIPYTYETLEMHSLFVYHHMPLPSPPRPCTTHAPTPHTPCIVLPFPSRMSH